MGAEAAQVMPYVAAPLVIEAVASVFGISVDVLRGGLLEGRGERLPTTARNAAAVLLKELTPMSNTEIAVALGRRDSSTGREIIVAGNKLLGKDPRFAQTVEQARKRLTEAFHV